MQTTRSLSRWTTVFVVTMLSLNSFSQGADPAGAMTEIDDNEQILLAIKQALVEEAQSSQSEVVNLSWLDSKGRLFDSTIIRSKLKVRGIQVKKYLDEINQPEIQVELDSLGASLPQCTGRDDKFQRTISIQTVDKDKEFGVDARALAQDVEELGVGEVIRLLRLSQYWGFQDAPAQRSSDTYNQIVSGPRVPESQFVLRTSVRLGRVPEMHRQEEIPGDNTISSYWSGRPSVLNEFWVRLQMELVSSSGLTLIWTGLADFRVPHRPVSYLRPDLPILVKSGITEKIQTWVKQLDGYASCEPVTFDLVVNQQNGFNVSGGSASGVSRGDRLLILDKDKIPNRALEPGALSDLSLVEVISVAVDSAAVKHVAGAQLGGSTNKVAMPF